MQKSIIVWKYRGGGPTSKVLQGFEPISHCGVPVILRGEHPEQSNGMRSFASLSYAYRFTRPRSAAAVHFVRMTNRKKKAAFTLAEVLITLGIIGIVAAMTMPMLTKKYRSLVLESQFKKGYSIAQQVILQAKFDFGGEGFAKYCTTLDPNYKVDPDTGEGNGVIPYPNNNYCYRILFNALNKSNTESMWLNDKYTVIRTDPVRTYNNRYEVTVEDAYAGGGNIWRMRQNRDGAWMNFHINEGKVYVTLDTNGYQKPNQLGHDIFRFYINKKNDTLATIQQTKAYTDEELEELDYKFEYQKQRAGDPCNSKSNQKANGIGCSYYAVNDINPDTGERGYWKNLP